MPNNDCLVRDAIVNHEPYRAQQGVSNGLPNGSFSITAGQRSSRIGFGLYSIDVVVRNVGGAAASGTITIERTPQPPGIADPSMQSVSTTNVASLAVNDTVKISVPVHENEYIEVVNGLNQAVGIEYYYVVPSACTGGSSGPASAVSIVPGTGEIDVGPFGGFGWLENYLKGSIDLDPYAGWAFNGVTPGGKIVKSPVGQGSASNTKDAVQINGGTLATHGIYQDANSSPATASTTWTLSVWARSVTGSVTVKLRLDSGNETGTEQSFNVGTSWQRISVTQSFSAASTGTVRSHIINGTSNVCLWGAQLNKSNKPGIFYPTGGNNYGVFGSVGHYGWVLGSGEAEGYGRFTGGVTIFSGTNPGKAALTIMNFSGGYFQNILNVYGSDHGHVGSIYTIFNGFEFNSADTTIFSTADSNCYIVFGAPDGAIRADNNTPTRAILRLSQASGQTEKSIRLFNFAGDTELFFVDKDGSLGFDKTLADSPGNVTINKPSGSAIIGAGTSSVVVTNSLVDADTHIVATVQTNDSTLKTVTVVPAAGSFTITGNANATANTTIRWTIIR